MSQSATSDNTSAVGLFPFLAVLLCTMGALLVLLVVLAQRIGSDAAVVELAEQPPAEATQQGGDPNQFARLASHLEEIEVYQQQLDEIKRAGEQRLAEERLKLSHSEDHMRRLEHELAQLALAAEQLKATEEEQVVDQQQAEKELARLEQLIVETEDDLEELRESQSVARSYAVVPFKGRHGTYAKPIYIVCDEHGITLQPEGLRFEDADFFDPSWPGNPLAAALRASREYLNNNARLAGEPEPLDPYPLIIVRPKGVKYYQLARRAIRSWDASYGYEFIDADWKLTYPELPDPQLARTQQHAVMIARERLAVLARAAPRKFRALSGLSANGNGGDAASSVLGPYDAGHGTGSGTTGADGQGEQLAGGEPGNGGTGEGSNSGGESFSDEVAHGETGEGGNSLADTGGEHGQGAVSGDSTGVVASADTSATASTGREAGQTGGSETELAASQAVGNSGQGGPGASGSQGAPSGSFAGGSAGEASASASGPSMSFSPQQSIADARGSDWAVQQAMRSAVPIQRPIQVVVRKNQVALLPSRHAQQGAGATGTVISLNQPLSKISDQFAAALKSRIEDWGLAGNGLYWRPVLELNVGPEAIETANRLVKLLSNSGVDVRLQETANAKRGDGSDGPK